MALLKTVVTTMVVSVLVVTLAVVGRLLAGRPIEAGHQELLILTLLVWTVVFLSFILLDALRNTLADRERGDGTENRRRKTLNRRFLIVVVGVCLTTVRLSGSYLGHELTAGVIALNVALAAAFVTGAIVVVDRLAGRQPK